ncbi:hypothetical protein H0R94_06725 [Treponema socranskii]|jgi:hypothetical protein|uniref:hypothetical protein n=1 Tax=Treponema socranskii TaxID=53419 RepID=UPI003D92CB8D
MKKIRDFWKKILITAICVIELLKAKLGNLLDPPKCQGLLELLEAEYEEICAEWKGGSLTKLLLTKLLEKVCVYYAYEKRNLSDMPMTAPKWMRKFLPLTDDGGIIIAGIRYKFIKSEDLYFIDYQCFDPDNYVVAATHRIEARLDSKLKRFPVIDLDDSAYYGVLSVSIYCNAADREEVRKCLAS